MQELLEVQAHFDLPSPVLVEKDYFVTKALAAITSADTKPFRLVLSGGTSLCRAYKLIHRMSEDIDLKIVGIDEPRRPELRHLRNLITQALLDAGFVFDPTNKLHRESFNESRYTLFRLPYTHILQGDGVLRPEIKMEVSVWPLHYPSVALSLSSFVADAFGRNAEVVSIDCVSVTQTAAEKFVALTRRAAMEISNENTVRDLSLIRHIYDLHIIRSHYKMEEVAKVARIIMKQDAKIFGNQSSSYHDNPQSETRMAISAIETDPHYSKSFDVFQRYMVYGESIDYAVCLTTLKELSTYII